MKPEGSGFHVHWTMDRLWWSGDDPVCHLSIIKNNGELPLRYWKIMEVYTMGRSLVWVLLYGKAIYPLYVSSLLSENWCHGNLWWQQKQTRYKKINDTEENDKENKAVEIQITSMLHYVLIWYIITLLNQWSVNMIIRVNEKRWTYVNCYLVSY